MSVGCERVWIPVKMKMGYKGEEEGTMSGEPGGLADTNGWGPRENWIGLQISGLRKRGIPRENGTWEARLSLCLSLFISTDRL